MLTYYFIFAAATSLTGLITIYIPLVLLARKLKVVNSVTARPVVSCIVMGVMLFITAPIVFYTLLSPKAFEQAKLGTYMVVVQEKD